MDKLLELYINATELSRDAKQTVGENNDYYITLEQLEALIKQLQEDSLV